MKDKSEDEVKVFVKKQIEERDIYYKQAKHIIKVHLMDNRKKNKCNGKQLISIIEMSRKALPTIEKNNK